MNKFKLPIITFSFVKGSAPDPTPVKQAVNDNASNARFKEIKKSPAKRKSCNKTSEPRDTRISASNCKKRNDIINVVHNTSQNSLHDNDVDDDEISENIVKKTSSNSSIASEYSAISLSSSETEPIEELCGNGSDSDQPTNGDRADAPMVLGGNKR